MDSATEPLTRRGLIQRLGKLPMVWYSAAPQALHDLLRSGEPDAPLDRADVLRAAATAIAAPPALDAAMPLLRLHDVTVIIPGHLREGLMSIAIVRSGPILGLSRIDLYPKGRAPENWQSRCRIEASGDAPGESPERALVGTRARYVSGPGLNLIRVAWGYDDPPPSRISFRVVNVGQAIFPSDLVVHGMYTDSKRRLLLKGTWSALFAASLPAAITDDVDDALLDWLAHTFVGARDRVALNLLVEHFRAEHPSLVTSLYERMNRASPEGHGITFHGISKLHDLSEGASVATDVRWFCDAFSAATRRSVVIVSGTLLGACREGTFLAHDDDVDLAYLSSETDPANVVLERELIRAALKNLGMSLSEAFGALFKVTFTSPLSARTLEVDLFTAHFTEDRRFREFPLRQDVLGEDDVLPLRTIALHGVELPCIRDPEALLALNYGEGWRAPDPTFRFDWSSHVPPFEYLVEHASRGNARVALRASAVRAFVERRARDPRVALAAARIALVLGSFEGAESDARAAEDAVIEASTTLHRAVDADVELASARVAALAQSLASGETIDLVLVAPTFPGFAACMSHLRSRLAPDARVVFTDLVTWHAAWNAFATEHSIPYLLETSSRHHVVRLAPLPPSTTANESSGQDHGVRAHGGVES